MQLCRLSVLIYVVIRLKCALNLILRKKLVISALELSSFSLTCGDICHFFAARDGQSHKGDTYAPDGPNGSLSGGCAGIVRVVLLAGGGTCK